MRPRFETIIYEYHPGWLGTYEIRRYTFYTRFAANVFKKLHENEEQGIYGWVTPFGTEEPLDQMEVYHDGQMKVMML